MVLSKCCLAHAGCDRGFYCRCLDPPLDSVLKHAWWCPKCVHEDNEDDENDEAF